MPKSKSVTKEEEPVKAGKKQEKKTGETKKESKVEVPVQTTQTKVSKKTQKGGEKEPKEPKEPKGKKQKRSFKALYVNPQGEVVIEGRYCGAKPKQAGCKALTGIYKLFSKAKKQIKGEIYFGVRETTRGSRNKTYYYCGERVVLDEPIELQIGGSGDSKTITYKYNSNVKKAQEADCVHLANPKEVEYEEPKKVTKKGEVKTEAKVTTEVEPEPEVEVEAEAEAEAPVEVSVETKKQSKKDSKKESKKTKQAKK